MPLQVLLVSLGVAAVVADLAHIIFECEVLEV